MENKGRKRSLALRRLESAGGAASLRCKQHLCELVFVGLQVHIVHNRRHKLVELLLLHILDPTEEFQVFAYCQPLQQCVVLRAVPTTPEDESGAAQVEHRRQHERKVEVNTT